MKRLLIFILLSLSVLSYSQTTYYVATDGDDGRSKAQAQNINTPWATWQKAINEVASGDTIFIRGGVYYLTGNNPWVQVNLEAWPNPIGVSGTRNARNFIGTYPPDYYAGNPAILDANAAIETYGTNFSVLAFTATEYWHVWGLTVRNAWQRGTASRRPQGIGATLSANMIFENCTTHDISARGFYYESGAWNPVDSAYAVDEFGANPSDARIRFPSDTTYWINCDTYNICDSVNLSSGDGWKAGNYWRGVFYFDGCRAWNYSDDGFDPGGAGKRVFNNCWAMATEKYASVGNIEGNGFKTGGIGGEQDEYDPDYRYVEMYNCIATNNRGVGFYNNLEAYYANGDYQNNALYVNNIAYNNYSGFGDVYTGVGVTRTSTYYNNISYDNTNANYEQVQIYNPGSYPAYTNTWIPDPPDWPAWDYNPAFTVTDADFVSLDTAQLRQPRKVDGSLPDITVFRLAAGSDLIDGGTEIGLPYSGAAPDLGPYEYYSKKLMFIHHSCGGYLLADNNGGLGDLLADSGYYVSNISYGWDATQNTNIGDNTDIGHWWTWFMDQTIQGNSIARRDNIMGDVYTKYTDDDQFGSYTRLASEPTGQNEIIMFKSCFPNSEILADNATTPADLFGTAQGNTYTESNVRALYDTLLTYFKDNTNRMFVVMTAPPSTSSTNATRARAFNDWLVDEWLQDADWVNKNVYVYDFFNVLTDADNHHWVVDGEVVHVTDAGSGNVLVYDVGDGHPNSTGNLKAAAEFVPVLDVWYETWTGYSGGTIEEEEIIEVTSITVSGTGDATTIETDGGTLQMLADILPEDATYQSVTWSRTNGTGTASINSSGLLTALTNGTVTVRATAVDGSGVYGEIVITISNQEEDEPAPPSGFGKVSNRFGRIGNKFIKVVSSPDVILEVDNLNLYFDTDGSGPGTFNITSNGSWTISISHEDIESDQMNGTGNALITITCEAGGLAEPLGTITISQPGTESIVITVYRGN